MNKETKIIQQKLVTSNIQFFTRTLIKQIQNGWKLGDNVRINSNPVYSVVLTKEVYLDDASPDFIANDCRPNNVLNSKTTSTNTQIAEEKNEDAIPPTVKHGESFEQRPYTAEEVATMAWKDIQTLSAQLGITEGKRPAKEAAIVEKSASLWGSVDAR